MKNDVRMQKQQEPKASRLKFPKGYTEADNQVDLLLWSHMVEQLEQAQNYWLATLSPNQQPHVTPVWGVWVDQALYFDGIPTARWARNMAANPAIAVHLESGIDVVILEGLVEDVVTDDTLGASIIDTWNTKYGRLLPEPNSDGIFRLRPLSARAWSQFPHDATRWHFA